MLSSSFTAEFAKRVRDLNQMDEPQLEAIAKKAKFFKTSDIQPWADLTEAIAKKEFEDAGQKIYLEGASPQEVALKNATGVVYESVDTVQYQRWADLGVQTAASGDKIRTDSYGNIISRASA